MSTAQIIEMDPGTEEKPCRHCDGEGMRQKPARGCGHLDYRDPAYDYVEYECEDCDGTGIAVV